MNHMNHTRDTSDMNHMNHTRDTSDMNHMNHTRDTSDKASSKRCSKGCSKSWPLLQVHALLGPSRRSTQTGTA